MNSKIKIKLGDIEVDYEGEQAFLEEKLGLLIQQLVQLHPKSTEQNRVPVHASAPGGESTAQLASRMKVSQGTELILAALASAHIRKDEPVRREDLVKAMRSATSFFRASYVKNLSTYLKTLVRAQKVNEVSSGTFSISSDEFTRLTGKH